MDPNVTETQEAIVANADYHTRLLKTVADLEYVPAAKKQQASYVWDLEAQLETTNKLIVELAKKTQKERKEHETLRDSTSRRLAHKLVGKKEKYAAKESKEEREYVEALEREMTARDNKVAIQGLLDEAKQVMVDLENKEQVYETAGTELDALYRRIFDGPSHAFPDDDRLEYDLNDAMKRHTEILKVMNSESRAAELLALAVKQMEFCQKNMNEALSYSTYDMWGGGSMIDMLERNALRQAQTNATRAESLVNQAMQTSPTVRPVGRIDITQGSVVSDVFFDNIWTDMAFHSKIKQSAAQVILAIDRVKLEREHARRRADEAGSHLTRAADRLDKSRRELADFRRATFESYVAQNPPPPSYDVVTSPPSATAAPNPPGPLTASPGPSMPTPSVPSSSSLSREAGNVTYAPPAGPPPNFESGRVSPGPTMPTSSASPSNTVYAPPAELPPNFVHETSTPTLAPETNTPRWGSRNPYALALSEQTRKLSM